MFAWLPFTTEFKAKMQRKAAAERQEQERLDRERIERNNRIKSMSEQTRFPQSPRSRTLYESSPARQYDSAPDITDMMNPANPLSPLFYPAPAYEPEPPRECPAPSYEPDTSSRYDSCSSSSSYDSGSSSSYDSGSSSSSSYD